VEKKKNKKKKKIITCKFDSEKLKEDEILIHFMEKHQNGPRMVKNLFSSRFKPSKTTKKMNENHQSLKTSEVCLSKLSQLHSVIFICFISIINFSLAI
jgi:hypothetical protein